MEHQHHYPAQRPATESPAEQQALQHVGHGSHNGPDSPEQHQGGTGMDHSKMGYDKQGGHDGHETHDHGAMIADFLRRFWICLALSVPVVLLSMMFRDLTDYQLDFPYRNAVVLVLATVIYGYGGWPFLTGMVGELRTRKLGMMTLIAVAITTAYVYSVVVSVGWLTGMDFFFELATLIVIMLLGHYIEMKSVAGASRSLELIIKLLPAEAHRMTGTAVTDVPVDTLTVGDVVLIPPGERIPTDGEVIEGNSAVNESMLTGESVPAQKTVRDIVIAGAVNGEGSLQIKVTHRGEDSYLNKVVQMVAEAQNAKSQNRKPWPWPTGRLSGSPSFL